MRNEFGLEVEVSFSYLIKSTPEAKNDATPNIFANLTFIIASHPLVKHRPKSTELQDIVKCMLMLTKQTCKLALFKCNLVFHSLPTLIGCVE
jgi:hypothetical protein